MNLSHVSPNFATAYLLQLLETSACTNEPGVGCVGGKSSATVAAGVAVLRRLSVSAPLTETMGVVMELNVLGVGEEVVDDGSIESDRSGSVDEGTEVCAVDSVGGLDGGFVGMLVVGSKLNDIEEKPGSAVGSS